METKGGPFWFHGLMGTGKTVMSSFIIETLLARDDVYVADVNPFLADASRSPSSNGTSPLQGASSAGNMGVVQFLLDNGADMITVGGMYWTPLQAACGKIHNLKMVRFLLQKGADVNTVGGEWGTALQAAAYQGSLDIASFLIENGADVNIKGGKYGTALQAASHKSYGRIEIVRFLIEKGADVNAVGGEYGTALQAAASEGNVEVVGLLIERGADLNLKRGWRGTALQAAASRGNLETVRFLVEKGADVNAVGRHKTALDEARDRDPTWTFAEKYEVEKFLRRCGAKTWIDLSDTSNNGL
ncbi:ankyrin repeat-containing domain protein [Flagelloscypha sp. PMI_526]|nr:ankyrin repeat-containing domain protein [Flagelloscypha sp. PMI_526]